MKEKLAGGRETPGYIAKLPQCKVQILTELINIWRVGKDKVYESVYLKGVCESGLSSDKQKHPYVTRKSDSRKLLGATPNRPGKFIREW